MGGAFRCLIRCRKCAKNPHGKAIGSCGCKSSVKNGSEYRQVSPIGDRCYIKEGILYATAGAKTSSRTKSFVCQTTPHFGSTSRKVSYSVLCHFTRRWGKCKGKNPIFMKEPVLWHLCRLAEKEGQYLCKYTKPMKPFEIPLTSTRTSTNMGAEQVLSQVQKEDTYAYDLAFARSPQTGKTGFSSASGCAKQSAGLVVRTMRNGSLRERKALPGMCSKEG